MGTIFYEVSVCAGGDFEIALENYSTPPQMSDFTQFLGRVDGQFVRIQVAYQPTILTVEAGACCNGESCIADGINRTCCEQTYPAATFTPGGTCADPLDCDPCPLESPNDSDGDTICNSVDQCPGRDDRIDDNNDGIPDCLQTIPTTSMWGLIVLALVLLTLAKTHCRRGAFV